MANRCTSLNIKQGLQETFHSISEIYDNLLFLSIYISLQKYYTQVVLNLYKILQIKSIKIYFKRNHFRKVCCVKNMLRCICYIYLLYIRQIYFIIVLSMQQHLCSSSSIYVASFIGNIFILMTKQVMNFSSNNTNHYTLIIINLNM